MAFKIGFEQLFLRTAPEREQDDKSKEAIGKISISIAFDKIFLNSFIS